MDFFLWMFEVENIHILHQSNEILHIFVELFICQPEHSMCPAENNLLKKKHCITKLCTLKLIESYSFLLNIRFLVAPLSETSNFHIPENISLQLGLICLRRKEEIRQMIIWRIQLFNLLLDHRVNHLARTASSLTWALTWMFRTQRLPVVVNSIISYFTLGERDCHAGIDFSNKKGRFQAMSKNLARQKKSQTFNLVIMVFIWIKIIGLV